MAQHEGTKAVASQTPRNCAAPGAQRPLPKARGGRGDGGGKEGGRGSHSCGCLWSVCEHLFTCSLITAWAEAAH